MALPNKLQAARITGASAVSNWPVANGNLETAICDILGITIDQNISTAVFGIDATGHITNNPIHFGAPPIGERFRNSTNSEEFRFVVDRQGGVAAACIDQNTGTELAPTWVRAAAWRLADGASIAGTSAGLAFSLVTASATLSNSVAWQTFNKTYTIPANTLLVGSVVRVTATVTFSSLWASGTARAQIRLGGGAAGSSSIGGFIGYTPPGGSSPRAYMQGLYTLVTAGAGGTGNIVGGFQGVTDGSTLAFSNPNNTVALDTTAGIVVQVDEQDSVANANNLKTLSALTVEILNPASTA